MKKAVLRSHSHLASVVTRCVAAYSACADHGFRGSGWGGETRVRGMSRRSVLGRRMIRIHRPVRSADVGRYRGGARLRRVRHAGGTRARRSPSLRTTVPAYRENPNAVRPVGDSIGSVALGATRGPGRSGSGRGGIDFGRHAGVPASPGAAGAAACRCGGATARGAGSGDRRAAYRCASERGGPGGGPGDRGRGGPGLRGQRRPQSPGRLGAAACGGRARWWRGSWRGWPRPGGWPSGTVWPWPSC